MVKGKNGISAKVIEDSVNVYGTRITTMELRFHRFILPEFNTHRMFSRNASSSRAIPVKKLCKQVSEDPAMPVYWGANQSGMQAKKECDNPIGYGTGTNRGEIGRETYWIEAASQASNLSLEMALAGYHKQLPNRLTECFQYSNVVVTATEWDNFFELRLHPDAQPEIHELARVMKKAMEESTPKYLTDNQWHLPYVTSTERIASKAKDTVKYSVARCARVSYKNHDNSDPDYKKDIALADMLLEAGHMSPFEHQATPMVDIDSECRDKENLDYLVEKDGVTHLDKNLDFWSGNFKNWIQYRQLI